MLDNNSIDAGEVIEKKERNNSNSLEEETNKLLNFIDNLLISNKKEETDKIKDPILIDIRDTLLQTHDIKDYYELCNFNIRNFALLINEIPKLKEYIKTYFQITDLRNFKQKERQKLGMLLYPNTDLLADIKIGLLEIGISDYESLIKYVYIDGSVSKISRKIAKYNRQSKKALKDGGFNYDNFKGEESIKLAKILGWDTSLDTSKEGLIKDILSYDVFGGLEYSEELIPINTK